MRAINLIFLSFLCLSLSGCLLADPALKIYENTPSIALINEQIKFSNNEDIYESLKEGLEEGKVEFENLYIVHLAVTEWKFQAQNRRWQPFWELTSKAYDPDFIRELQYKDKKKKDIEYIELPKEIIYGEPIKGMEVLTPAIKLKEGIRYRLNMDIYGERDSKLFYVLGHKNFILKKNNGVLEIEEPSDLDYYNLMMEQRRQRACSKPEKTESCS